MLHNSSTGHFMEITDYYGSNVSRFSMSHVDFSIILLSPLHYIFPSAFFLVVFQRLIFFVTSLVLFYTCRKLKFNYIESISVSLLVFLMPISGFNLVNASFHPLIFSLLLVPTIYLLSFSKKRLTNKRKIAIFLLYLITLFSKEELGLVLALFSIFMLFKFKKDRVFFLMMGFLSFIWSLVAIFYIIPLYDYQRSASLDSFLNNLNISSNEIQLEQNDDNYFLYRYRALGSSYSEIIKNSLLNPLLFAQPFLQKESLKTTLQVYSPVFFVTLVNPPLFFASLVEIGIHGLSGSEEIFSIENHRLTILIPLLLISVIEFVLFLKRRNKLIPQAFVVFLLIYNIAFSLFVKSPLLFLTFDKIKSVFIHKVLAVDFSDTRIQEISDNDCARNVLALIPGDASVSSPQMLGAFTSDRRVNALFPSAIDRVDYVIIDIKEKKISNNLGIDSTLLLSKGLEKINNDSHKIIYSCNRFTLVKRVN